MSMMLVVSASCAHDELSTGVWVHDLTIKGTRALSPGDIEDKLAMEIGRASCRERVLCVV